MARNILLRFQEEDELIKKIDELRKRLGVTASNLTKTAIFEYIKKMQETK